VALERQLLRKAKKLFLVEIERDSAEQQTGCREQEGQQSTHAAAPGKEPTRNELGGGK
jgi:hypothetical protein